MKVVEKYGYLFSHVEPLHTNVWFWINVQAAWELFTPLLHRIDDGAFRPIKYKPGSRGPAEADKLLGIAGYVHTDGYLW